MRPKSLNKFKALAITVLALAICGFTAEEDFERGVGPKENFAVSKTFDGDSLLMATGEQLRYLGINAPEYNEPFGQEAKAENIRILEAAKELQFQRCLLEEKDKYDRVLAFVYADGVDVQEALIKKGLAFPAAIPPCGTLSIYRYEAAAAEARKQKLGIWHEVLKKPLKSEEAAAGMRQYRGVRGRVSNIFETRSVIYLNFGKDYKTDFTVAIFKRDAYRFKARGIDFKKLKGKKITVFGFVMEHNGPEIVANTPDQMLLK